MCLEASKVWLKVVRFKFLYEVFDKWNPRITEWLLLTPFTIRNLILSWKNVWLHFCQTKISDFFKGCLTCSLFMWNECMSLHKMPMIEQGDILKLINTVTPYWSLKIETQATSSQGQLWTSKLLLRNCFRSPRARPGMHAQ